MYYYRILYKVTLVSLATCIITFLTIIDFVPEIKIQSSGVKNENGQILQINKLRTFMKSLISKSSDVNGESESRRDVVMASERRRRMLYDRDVIGRSIDAPSTTMLLGKIQQWGLAREDERVMAREDGRGMARHDDDRGTGRDDERGLAQDDDKKVAPNDDRGMSPDDERGIARLKAGSSDIRRAGTKSDLRWRLAEAMNNNCDYDDLSTPTLKTIVTDPLLKLIPEFAPEVTEYKAVVGYETCLIKLWAVPRSCLHEVRLEIPNGTNRPINFTIGIGLNRLNIYLVLKNRPKVVRTYHVTIHRPGLEDVTSDNRMGPEMNVCVLLHDCGLSYLAGQPCGLHKHLLYRKWSDYTAASRDLPICSNGNVTGRWLVPCLTCGDTISCVWREARWQLDGCRYRIFSGSEVRQCMNGKKLLFVGDSTNRGVMYYNMEAINGTLQRWRKVHDLELYYGLNNGATVTGFSYYPKYWMDPLVRPTLEESLRRLVNRMKPLENNSQTVIIIGGVQWLTSQQIKTLKNSLSGINLDRAKLVFKTYNAGFTILSRSGGPVSTARFSALEQQNQAVIRTALNYANAHVVDTFRLTMARYREFTRGVCACHFHTVNEMEMQSSSNHQDYNQHSSSVFYHVEGKIHELYSQMIINRICDPKS